MKANLEEEKNMDKVQKKSKMETLFKELGQMVIDMVRVCMIDWIKG